MNKQQLALNGSSKCITWETPQYLFEELDKEFHFEIDLSASSLNAKCELFYSTEQNSLIQDWKGVCWLNPPYGREITKWIKKAHLSAVQNGATIVALLPAKTDTKAFHEYIYGKYEIRFIKGRLHFSGHIWNAPFPSMIVIFKK